MNKPERITAHSLVLLRIRRLLEPLLKGALKPLFSKIDLEETLEALYRSHNWAQDPMRHFVRGALRTLAEIEAAAVTEDAE